jgi:hypothetical protein
LSVTTDPAKITAKLSAATVKYGAKDILSGLVTYQPQAGAAYVAAADEPVEVVNAAKPGIVIATVYTNSSGNYSLALPATVGAIWTVEAGGFTIDDLLAATTAKATESVEIPTAVTSFKTSLDPFWELTYSGCLALPSSVPTSFFAGNNGAMVLQASPDKSGPWYTVKSHPTVSHSTCGHDGLYFAGSTQTPYNYAYYRMYYPGTKAAATPTAPQFGASAATPQLAWKYADRFAGLSVSPTTVSSNGNITVKGQLEYYKSGWHAFADQVVLIVLKPKGGSKWYYVAQPKTDSSGKFSLTLQDYEGSATWSAYYGGSSTHLATGPPGTYVAVK